MRRRSLEAIAAIVLGAAATAQVGTNLLTNPGFETGGTEGWFTTGAPSFDSTMADAHAGQSSGFVSRRLAAWQGPAIDLLPLVQQDRGYRITLWVRTLDTLGQDVQLTLFRQQDVGSWTELERVSFDDFGWHKLSGIVSLDQGPLPSALYVYLQGPSAGVDFFVDSASFVQLPHWRTDANERIERLRKRTVKVFVTDANGAPLPAIQIQVDQDHHHFGFGSAIRSEILTNAQYRQFFLDHFEWAVPENELKWWYNEPTQGSVSYNDAQAMLLWCRQNRIPARGHNIFWATPQGNPGWLLGLSAPLFQLATENRMNDVVLQFKGEVVHWDVNNEMLHGNVSTSRLGSGIRTWMFQEARAIDPSVKLFVNDFDVVAENRTRDYLDQIAELLIAGAPIDGIGVQGHFQDVDPYLMRQRLDTLLRPNLPIWFTEVDVNDADDSRRADKLERLYRTAFSHAGVQGIVMWGFWEGAHWRPNAAIVDLNWQVNEAGQRLEQMMAEWTTNKSGATNGVGGYVFRGFHGQYTVTLTPPGGPAETHQLQLLPGAGTVTLTFQLGTGN